MGVEAKKPEAKKMEEKKPSEESKKREEGKQDKEAEDDKKEDKKKAEESKEGSEAAPPPPQEIVLKVYMHCEGCARKVRRSLKCFDGVEDVVTDCRTNKVVVKGEKADPLRVMERVQRKSHRQVELLSPVPKPPLPPPPAQEEKKPEPTGQPNPPEKKEEPKVVTVVLKVHMHCDACSQEIKKRILRMKGVESVEPDLKGSQVSVTGVFEPAKLVEYVYKRTGKHTVIVKQEPEKKGEEAGKESSNKEEKKGDDGGGGGNKKGGGDGGGKPETSTGEEEVDNLGGLELKKNENLYYPPYYLPRFVQVELHGEPHRQPYQYQYPYPSQYQYQPGAAYPPQIFSDENPNACSVM